MDSDEVDVVHDKRCLLLRLPWRRGGRTGRNEHGSGAGERSDRREAEGGSKIDMPGRLMGRAFSHHQSSKVTVGVELNVLNSEDERNGA